MPLASAADSSVVLRSCLHWLSIFFRISATILGIALVLLISVDGTLAATIEHLSLRHAGLAVEVDFEMQGRTPRWRIRGHGQNLYLDLESTHVTGSSEAAPALFPVTGVAMHNIGGNRALLVIVVRGRVDYVVAQMPHELVVRIAPSGRAIDLAQPLLTELEQGRQWRPEEEGSTSGRETARSVGPIVKGSPRAVTDDNFKANSLSIRSESVVPRSSSVTQANPPTASPLAFRDATQDQQAAIQALGPVTQRAAADSWHESPRLKPLVVIDAGHGGFDPGTESAGGVTEKTVALAIARRLAAALKERGVAAELTRSGDSFLSLGERTNLANQAHADLFVSVHLNSSPNPNTSGIETYYLNNTTDRATIRLARMENGGDYGTANQSNLHYILANLRQDYKALESSSLARMIEVEAATNVETTLGIRLEPLGAKMGPFYILVGAEMPSVLIECGFLSNLREAQFLLQPGYQQALAEGITLAIMHYFHADAAVGNL